MNNKKNQFNRKSRMLLGMIFILMWICFNGCATHSTLVHPKLIEAEKLEYPLEAEEMGIEGLTNITMEITKQGDVDQARVVKSSGSEILDNAALDYVKKLKYDPAREEGKPVNIWMSLVIDFTLKKTPFDPVEYADNIHELYNALQKETADSLSMKMRQEALALHERFIRLTESYPKINYNTQLKKFILKDIQKEWDPLWDQISLRFLVFYDYLTRFNETDEARYAQASMVYFFRQDIDNINLAVEQNSIRTKEKMRQVILALMKNHIND